MIDVTVPETFTLTISLEDGKRGGGGSESQLQNIKKVFANAVKNAIHGDSTSTLSTSLLLTLPYFIIIAGVFEIFMYIFATKDVRNLLIYNPERKCDLWRFLTYMTLHNDCTHLSLNIIIQFLLAGPLEYEQGHVRTIAIYLGGGLAGSLGASIFDKESMLVGASGGIYALLTSHVAHIILNRNTLRYVLHRSLAVCLLALADILYICYHIYMFKNEDPRIGLAAHFAGALSGLFLGASFFKGTVKWKNNVHIVSAVAAIILYVVAVFINLTSVQEAAMYKEIEPPKHGIDNPCYVNT